MFLRAGGSGGATIGGLRAGKGAFSCELLSRSGEVMNARNLLLWIGFISMGLDTGPVVLFLAVCLTIITLYLD